MTPDGRLAVSGSEDRTVKVWDLMSGTERATLAGHTGSVDAVAMAPDGRLAVSGSEDRTLRIWDLKRGLVAVFTADHAIVSCAMAAEGTIILAGDISGRVHFLRLEEA